jgi:O-antigen/teichoic acid export membrane protein
LFPRLSGAFSNKEEIRRILTKHTIGLGLAGTLTVALLSFLSAPLIRVLFSEKFLVVLPVVKMLNVFLIISFFNVLYSDSLNAFNRQSQRMTIIVMALILNIFLNVILIPVCGLMGAVYASICAQLLILVLSYIQVQRIYSINAGGYICGFLLAGLLLVGLSFEFPGAMAP